MLLLHMTGTPRQRGQMHGEQLRVQIAAVLDLWKADIERETHLPAHDYLRRFLAETDFLPAIQRWTPHLLDDGCQA